MTGGGWGCPFEENGDCAKRELPCEPGEQGCVLHGRFERGKKKASGAVEKDNEPAKGGKP